MNKKILITGRPGIGKTTLIRKLAESLKDYNPIGFYTAEIRERGERKGFELIGFDGKRKLLSHIDIDGRFRVGKYGVDVGQLEDFLAETDFDNPDRPLIIIDEIGKMECLSQVFVNMISKIMDSEKMVIAVVALKGGGLIETVKRQPGVVLFEVTLNNRSILPGQILALLQN